MFILRHVFQRLIDHLRCSVGRHIYLPSYEVRQFNHLNGRYSHKEFRFTCSCCQQPTRWLRWRRLEAFMAKHQPDWKHARFRDEFC
jgi:hypothetical protein